MRLYLATLSLAATMTAASAQAATCPNTVYYANGNYLKSGGTFYYSNGNYLKSGSSVYYSNGNYLRSGSTLYYRNGNYLKSGTTLYHANGNYLRSSSTWYYANGNYLKSGSTLYYPGGNYLRSGSTLYYQNGNYLRSGTTFYHPNGSYARSGSTLYRPDGTRTPFDVLLTENIGTEGTLTATVSATSELISIELPRIVDTADATGEVVWNGFGSDETQLTRYVLKDPLASTIATEQAGGDFRLETQIDTGAPGEQLTLRVSPNGDYECFLEGGGAQRDFTLDLDAARLEVHVKPGYDPATVKAALQRALNEL
jgi:hypothetical protein